MTKWDIGGHEEEPLLRAVLSVKEPIELEHAAAVIGANPEYTRGAIETFDDVEIRGGEVFLA